MSILKKHRKVMKEHLEKRLGKEISELFLKEFVVHHKDKNKKNNNLTNLKLMTTKGHTSHHHAGRRKVKPND